jgi:hypothetical protein
MRIWSGVVGCWSCGDFSVSRERERQQTILCLGVRGEMHHESNVTMLYLDKLRHPIERTLFNLVFIEHENVCTRLELKYLLCQQQF